MNKARLQKFRRGIMQLFGKNSPDMRKFVGVNFSFQIEYTLFVQVIDPHPSGRVNDLIALHHDTNMVYFPL